MYENRQTDLATLVETVDEFFDNMSYIETRKKEAKKDYTEDEYVEAGFCFDIDKEETINDLLEEISMEELIEVNDKYYLHNDRSKYNYLITIIEEYSDV